MRKRGKTKKGIFIFFDIKSDRSMCFNEVCKNNDSIDIGEVNPENDTLVKVVGFSYQFDITLNS